jgi:histidine triad (HIT) family protein
MPSIFTRIIQGEIPSHKVYEDAHVFAFLDINPLSRGHTLVVPRQEAVTLDQLDDESAAAIGRVLPRLCRAVMKATGATAYNILQNNGPLAHQAVPHVHFHIIPRFDRADDFGLALDWECSKLDPAVGSELCKQIARHCT